MPRRPTPPTPDPVALKAAMAGVRAIYAEWESRPLERSCVGRADCCHFLRTGRTPYLTSGEALVLAAAWRAAGRTTIPSPGPDGACAFLSAGKCLVHPSRPFGCRTHFCAAAGGPATRAETRDLIQRLETIDHSLGGEGGVNLPLAVERAMETLASVNKRRRQEP